MTDNVHPIFAPAQGTAALKQAMAEASPSQPMAVCVAGPAEMIGREYPVSEGTINAMAEAKVRADRAREWTEFTARFEHVQRLAMEARDADEAHRQIFREKPDPKDDEACVRWELRQLRLCRASLAAKENYHKACNEFFLNAAERGAP